MPEAEQEEWTFDLTGGRTCLDFANTVSGSRAHPIEHLRSYENLVAWSRQAGVVTEAESRILTREARRRPQEAAATLTKAINLREAIYRIFAAVADGLTPELADLTVLNATLSRALPHLRIAPTQDGFSWTWETEPGALDEMLWRVARSATDLLVSEDERTRVRKCASDRCDWLFMDKSRNLSRRWCDMSSCGNRAKARRYYERKQRGTSAATPPATHRHSGGAGYLGNPGSGAL